MARIVVIGGTGLIGSKVVAKLTAHGHEAIAASPNSGVDTVTGEGLAEALLGADVVVDVSNSPSFEASAVMEFFTTSTRNLIAAEREAGVAHHVALTVVGTDRPQQIAYFHAKAAQEKLIRESGIPYSIVHATQFFEFIRNIIDNATHGGKVRVADVLVQPMAAADVAAAVAEIAVGSPLDGMVEFAGPEVFSLEQLASQDLRFRQDDREVTADPLGTYFGARLQSRELLPEATARIAPTRYHDWRTR